MKIAGIQKNSFVDYRGKIAAVVFTQGCNMNCFYCHNRGILCEGEGTVCKEKTLEFLQDRRKFLDGVVVSGGEPTLQKGLFDFIKEVKEMGYLVKLDTNGTHPKKLNKLINAGLIDFVAMDIKAPLDRYDEISGVAVNRIDIEESIELLMRGRVDYEFRTTVVPEFFQKDLMAIVKRIEGAKLYILQQFRPPLAFRDIVDYRALKTPHSPAFIHHMKECIAPYVIQHETRGVG